MKYVVATILLFGCGESGRPAEDEHDHGGDAHEEHGAETHREEGMVSLTEIQLANADLQYSTLDTLNISGFVKTNGILDLPPQNIAAVSAPMDGFVKKVNYLVGDYVKKGAVLAVLEHMDYIKLQEEYLNVINNLEYLESEYERQRQLDSAQVTAKKQFQAASVAYKSALTRKKALEKQLQYMGLSPKSIAAGEISGSIAIRAPLSGYITALNVHNGAFVQSQEEIYELVDTDHMHLELNVFEQDINKIKIGQLILFTVPGLGEERYRGSVFLIGKSFDRDSKTVKVHGHIEEEHHEFLRGLYVEAKIYSGDEHMAALPEESIVNDQGQSYVFVLVKDIEEHENEEHHHAEGHSEAVEDHGITFRRVPVGTGIKDQGYVQIKQIADLPHGSQFVTKGAYYLYSEMKKGEGGHHHH
ncbi:cation efflux system protein [Fulvivirga imtechensis AK7]|uniref:Cation efflux system protein n=1 Tax=Fulvivirga imtechensis AK7 TaxID=1237149 RepID=L8K0N7_9BACT|nr:cation efflux system protein [Fulvivirga imtechensis AK7]